MGALLQNLAVGQEDDVVRVLDGAQPVGNDQHGANVLHLLQGVLDQHLRLGVDVGGGLIENHDGGLVNNGSGKGQQLALAGGEVVAPLPDHLVQAVFQPAHEGIGVDIAAGLPDLLIADALGAQDDVAADIAGEQEHILQHLAEVPAQGGDFDLFDIDAVDEDLALLDVVVPADQGQDRGLAGAGGAHKGHGLSGFHMEGNALQYPFIGLVGKPHILEFDLAPDFLQLDGIRLVHHIGNHVQNGEDLLRRGKGLLQHIKLLRQRLNGVEELGDVHVEGNHNLAGDGLAQEGGVPDVALAADVEQEQVAGDKEHIHHGAENAEDQHPVELGPPELAALFQEFLHFLILPVEDLGDLHAGEVFGQEGIQVGSGVVDAPVNLPGELLKNQGEDHQEGHKAQHHQGQRIIQHQHGSQHAEDHHGVFQQGHQNVGKQKADGVGVVADPGDQLAHGNLVQLLMGQAFDSCEGVQTDLGQDLLTHRLQDHGLEIGTDHGDHQNARVQNNHGIEPGQLKAAGFDEPLDSGNQQRGHHVIDDGHRHDDKHQDKFLRIGSGIAQQPADQLTVGHAALGSGLFDMVLQDKIGHDKHHGEHTDDGAGNEQRQIFTHYGRLLPLPAAAGPPSCGRPHFRRRALRGCQSPPACRRR